MKYASVLTLNSSPGGVPETIRVESIIRRGLPSFSIGGLGGGIRETTDRIRTAILACGIQLPLIHISVNLSPVDIPKRGGYLDLPIAASILKSLGFSLFSGGGTESGGEPVYLGELGLSGEILSTPAVLPMAIQARLLGVRSLVFPEEDLDQVRRIPDLILYPVKNLRDLFSIPPDPVHSGNGGEESNQGRTSPPGNLEELSPLLSTIRLPLPLWSALQVAAAGWHSILLVGPPGSGKSMMARLIASLVPPPVKKEKLEIGALFPDISMSRLPDWETMARPVRAPHHSATVRALIGGGLPPTPGEVTRAHNGILLLDELAEFSRGALQSLREPLEESKVRLSRGNGSAEFPARFLLVATSNPCPCGYAGNRSGKTCVCSPTRIRAYRQRLLGPLRDRIDMEFVVDQSDHRVEIPGGIDSFLDSIMQASRRQRERYGTSGILRNGDWKGEEAKFEFAMEDGAKVVWEEIVDTRRFSLRKLAGVKRLARTLADLAGAARIRAKDLLEASSFQILDDYWLE